MVVVMQGLLLDTHTLLWMVLDDPRLSRSARDEIINADTLHYSMVSLWEIAVKQGRQGFDLQLPDYWHQGIPEEMTRQGITRLEITPTYVREVQDLPGHHGDPFDRMLVAQALVENLALVTKDRTLKQYGVKIVW